MNVIGSKLKEISAEVAGEIRFTNTDSAISCLYDTLGIKGSMLFGGLSLETKSPLNSSYNRALFLLVLQECDSKNSVDLKVATLFLINHANQAKNLMGALLYLFDKSQKKDLLKDFYTKQFKQALTAFLNRQTPQEKISVSLKDEVQKIKTNAAKKIQARVREFQNMLKAKSPDAYGFRSTTHESSEQKYLFSKNSVVYKEDVDHTQIDAKDGKQSSGTYKQLVNRGEHSVLFKSKTTILEYGFNTHDIEKVLLDLKIQSFQVTHPISSTDYIAHNAGKYNLYQCRWDANNIFKQIQISDFKPILKDFSELHKAGYFHGDMKSLNIVVGETKTGKIKLTVVDWDTFCSPNKGIYPEVITTTIYSTLALSKKVLPQFFDVTSKELPDNNVLQVNDEFSLAISILFGMGIDLYGNDKSRVKFEYCKLKKENKDFSYPFIKSIRINDPKINQFIQDNIKPEHILRFNQLLRDPVKYLEDYLQKDGENTVYLYDMFK